VAILDDWLPRLKMIASTAPFNASIDMAAAADHGIHVGTTGGTIASTVEFDVGAHPGSLAQSRRREHGGAGRRVADIGGPRAGWTRPRCSGLGHIGKRVARIGKAFGMEVIAWSQNLTVTDVVGRCRPLPG
jgi:phosphoglycerate dehydrogenase-like enzyme